MQPVTKTQITRPTHEQERVALKNNRKIADMNTGKILIYLASKHRFFLSLSGNFMLITFIIVKGF